MSAFVSHYHQPIRSEEQQIYDHLLHCIDVESPEQMIERFRSLFIDGSRYPNSEILDALDQVTASKQAAEEFRFVLNRSCHILINRWQARSQSQQFIPKLIELFETAPSVSSVSVRRSRSIRRLHGLTQQFTETEQYLTLRRLVQALDQAVESGNVGDRPLGTLIRRYPYLYDHCLLSEDSTIEQQSTVRQLQSTVQRKFEIDLSQYMTYQFRCGQRAASQQTQPSAGLSAAGFSTNPAARFIQPVANPTLLEDREVIQSLHHYVGRVEGSRSYKDLANNLLAQSKHSQTFGAFKDDLYEYITQSTQSDYGRRQFNNQLYDYLDNILPNHDSKILDDLLIVRTCGQLLNFLIVGNPQHPQHFVFIDLLNNMGPMLTTGLLLKIVLLCRKVKPILERRFSILFSHYETYTRDAVDWLIRMLENLNVAFSAHFGSLDLAFIR